jgi:leader peptidase (prepilin peptidase)/N-methyltransferase
VLIDIFVILFALVFGSFLNVLIYRLPLEKSFFTPIRSACPKCSYQLKWYENIPLISYIFLKAKCSSCKSDISIIYFIVELLSVIVTYSLYLKLGLNYNFYITTLLFYILIVLSFIDLKYKAVPDYLLLIALVCTFFIQNINYQDMFIFTGAFVLLNFILTFYIQNIKSKITKNKELQNQTALGEGDIPIVAIIAAILGLKLSIIAVFIASITAIIPSIYNIIQKDDIETPFIPFLVFGLFLTYIFDTKILYFTGL